MKIYGVTVPKWGLSMEEGKIVCWHVAPGARVVAGDPLADIETSKITNTLESVHGGVVRRILANPDETRACGELIAVIDGENASEKDIDSFIEKASLDVAAIRSRNAEEAGAKFVEAYGHRIRYLASGHGGTPVLLLHGFGGDLNSWLFNRPALASGRKVIALDLPGHGGSDKNVGEGTIEEIAAILAGAIEALGLGRFHLVGHSLGGAIAVNLAATKLRDSVVSLALVAPSCHGQEINQDFVSGFIEARKRRDLQKVLGLLFADPSLVTPAMAEDVLRFKRLDGAENALRKIAEANFPASGRQVDLRDRLAGLDIPTLVVWGLEDKIVPPPRDGLCDLAIERFPGVGHMPHMEATAAVNRAFVSFFSGHE